MIFHLPVSCLIHLTLLLHIGYQILQQQAVKPTLIVLIMSETFKIYIYIHSIIDKNKSTEINGHTIFYYATPTGNRTALVAATGERSATRSRTRYERS